MKVVFVEEVPGTAVPGDVKEVRDGFARNYLLPRKLAVPATKAALQKAELLSHAEERRQESLDVDARRIVERLEGQKISIIARVGEQGRLYGSITAADIAERLDALLGESIDRRRILLSVPIREVGTRQVPVRLTRNITASVEVVIEADESSTRGRRSSAPAGGSIIMSPRRERVRRPEYDEDGYEIEPEDEQDGDTAPMGAELENAAAGDAGEEAAAERADPSESTADAAIDAALGADDEVEPDGEVER
jgi:large subunit ribosomal protein L9